MGEILGLGCTHYPGLTVPDERLPAGFYRLLTAPGVPAHYKDRANWPAELVTELGNDEGYSAAQRYSARMADDFRAIRAALDAFNPDLVLVWGDDQYENFREDIIPAFCVLGLDDDFAVLHRVAVSENSLFRFYPLNNVNELFGDELAKAHACTRSAAFVPLPPSTRAS